ncbi:MAG: helix-turn-helix domain-containing protein [Trichodesmium sp.]
MVNLPAIKNIKKNLSFFPLKKDFQPEKKYSFAEEQSQSLADIGNRLKRFREKNSISLERVAVVTMIRINLLEAIEAGNLEQLPEPVYIQGLIKRYADSMGLDGEQLANLFLIEETEKISRKSSVKVSMFQLRPYHLYFLYVLTIILSVRLLPYVISGSYLSGIETGINKSEQEQNQGDDQNNLLAQATSSEKKIEQKSVVQTKTEKPEKQKEKQPVVLNIIVKEESWVSIEIDGKIEFEGTLSKGTEKTWSAQKQLVLFAGNAGGILIPINESQTMRLGKIGEVKEVVFTPTDNQIFQSKTTNN